MLLERRPFRGNVLVDASSEGAISPGADVPTRSPLQTSSRSHRKLTVLRLSGLGFDFCVLLLLMLSLHSFLRVQSIELKAVDERQTSSSHSDPEGRKIVARPLEGIVITAGEDLFSGGKAGMQSHDDQRIARNSEAATLDDETNVQRLHRLRNRVSSQDQIVDNDDGTDEQRHLHPERFPSNLDSSSDESANLEPDSGNRAFHQGLRLGDPHLHTLHFDEGSRTSGDHPGPRTFLHLDAGSWKDAHARTSQQEHVASANALGGNGDNKNNNDIMIMGEEGGVSAINSRCPSNFETPSPERKQKCCRFSVKSLTCLPNLVVIGAQKGGTTALHSFLLLHPNLLPAKKKELHLFDIDLNFGSIASKLKSIIPGLPIPINTSASSVKMSVPFSLPKDKITFDSSPSYIADRRACPRMAAVLAKDARFVMLLREPVERAWSDIAMKMRRIQTQDEFLNVIIPKYHSDIDRCFKTVTTSLGRNQQQQQAERPTSEIPGEARNLQVGNLQRFRECLPADVGAHGRVNAFFKYLFMKSPHAVKFLNVCLRSESAARDCLQDEEFKNQILSEKMPDIPQVIRAEALNLQRAMVSCCLNASSTESNDADKRSRMARLLHNGRIHDGWNGDSSDQAEEFRMSRLENRDCTGCGCRCFPRGAMMSDISKNYLWRSMYHPQLVHCLQSLPRDRVLILDMRDLRSDPARTLSAVFAHAGLPPFDVSAYTTEQAHGLFVQHYPDFETVSGWSHVGRTDEAIPEDLRLFMEDFFRPYNKRLFEYLNIEPFTGWKV